MAASRFAVSGDDELKKLKDKASNSNTKKAHKPGLMCGLAGLNSSILIQNLKKTGQKNSTKSYSDFMLKWETNTENSTNRKVWKLWWLA